MFQSVGQLEIAVPAIHAMDACAVCNNGIYKDVVCHLPLPVLRNLPAGRGGSGRCCCGGTIASVPPVCHLAHSVSNRLEKRQPHQKEEQKTIAAHAYINGDVWTFYL